MNAMNSCAFLYGTTYFLLANMLIFTVTGLTAYKYIGDVFPPPTTIEEKCPDQSFAGAAALLSYQMPSSGILVGYSWYIINGFLPSEVQIWRPVGPETSNEFILVDKTVLTLNVTYQSKTIYFNQLGRQCIRLKANDRIAVYFSTQASSVLIACKYDSTATTYIMSSYDPTTVVGQSVIFSQTYPYTFSLAAYYADDINPTSSNNTTYVTCPQQTDTATTSSMSPTSMIGTTAGVVMTTNAVVIPTVKVIGDTEASSPLNSGTLPSTSSITSTGIIAWLAIFTIIVLLLIIVVVILIVRQVTSTATTVYKCTTCNHSGNVTGDEVCTQATSMTSSSCDLRSRKTDDLEVPVATTATTKKPLASLEDFWTFDGRATPATMLDEDSVSQYDNLRLETESQFSLEALDESGSFRRRGGIPPVARTPSSVGYEYYNGPGQAARKLDGGRLVVTADVTPPSVSVPAGRDTYY